jgi:ubiquinone/menaquinone biosynthesis C-methylase UbiE
VRSFFVKKYIIKNNIYVFEIKNKITNIVKNFYKNIPFPNYSKRDDIRSVVEKGNKNIFISNLKKKIGNGIVFLEAGSGTSQLSIYLSIGTNNKIYALDGALKSLEVGSVFAQQQGISNVNFINADILDLDNVFYDNSFDYIWSSGVLHHTENPKLAFKILTKKLKKNGFFFIGLYNRYGRIRTIIRRFLFKIFGKKIVILLDPFLRALSRDVFSNKEKIESWIHDQYSHPVESTHTYGEVLSWFDENDIQFVNSYPNMFQLQGSFFEEQPRPNIFERLVQQICMIFTKLGGEGGLFIFIGKKI